ncbi:MAG: hypothetical protein QN174_08485 [Armatimonadota bacterium]|nr:hypothetical protein [Armatimonadota bacterium]
MIAPRAIAAVRDAWHAAVPVRTMPFARDEADPEAPLLVTFGDADDGLEAPPVEACALLAAALADARGRPLRLMVRFDYRGVIVRGDVAARGADAAGRAVATVPALAALVRDVVSGALDRPHATSPAALPPGLQLLTARFDEGAGAWQVTAAHGFADGVWHRTLADAPEPGAR